MINDLTGLKAYLTSLFDDQSISFREIDDYQLMFFISGKAKKLFRMLAVKTDESLWDNEGGLFCYKNKSENVLLMLRQVADNIMVISTVMSLQNKHLEQYTQAG